MKNLLLTASVIFFLFSCGSNKAEPGEPETDTTATAFNWEASLDDSSDHIKLNRMEESGPDSLTPSSVIAFLNIKRPSIQLRFIKISGDTMYVSIPDALYLTQQMGSTGPRLFFAETVYNLTEIPGIKYVDFALEEGDHAGPETLNRESFRDE